MLVRMLLVILLLPACRTTSPAEPEPRRRVHSTDDYPQTVDRKPEPKTEPKTETRGEPLTETPPPKPEEKTPEPIVNKPTEMNPETSTLIAVEKKAEGGISSGGLPRPCYPGKYGDMSGQTYEGSGVKIKFLSKTDAVLTEGGKTLHYWYKTNIYCYIYLLHAGESGVKDPVTGVKKEATPGDKKNNRTFIIRFDQSSMSELDHEDVVLQHVAALP